MVLLAPTLAASRYLDQTEQWSRLPPETKDHAVDLIQKGSGCRPSGSGARAGNGRWAAQAAGAGMRGCPMGTGSVAVGTNSSCLSSPRLHADPAVSENRRFLWGMATSGQQHLVRLGSVALGL